MTEHLRNRRQLRRAVLTTVIIVLGVGVWQGVAGATATGPKTVKIQGHNANCGHPSGKGPIGTATFSRDGTEIIVDVNLTDASKFTDYFVELWKANNNGGCEPVADMGGLSTDGAGQAEGVFTADVGPKKHNFFVDVALVDGIGTVATTHGPQSSFFDNDSLIAHL